MQRNDVERQAGSSVKQYNANAREERAERERHEDKAEYDTRVWRCVLGASKVVGSLKVARLLELLRVLCLA